MWFKKKKYKEVEPDEIFIDSANLPGFDSSRLEGRIERPISGSTFRYFILFVLLIGVVFTMQLMKLQIFDAEALSKRAEANSLEERVIIAERGLITDRNNKPLALNEWNEDLGFSIRKYPLGEALAQLIGYVSYPKRDQNGYWFQDTTEGLAGLESSLDGVLRGENGVEIKETTATGEHVSGSVVRVPQNGKEVTLSIDSDLQKELYESIKYFSDFSGFLGGSGVIVDVHTGEVYALASYPSYDPEIVSSGEDKEAIQSYVLNERAPFLDRAISGLYTPGSVVKPFIALAALEEDVISPEKQILSTGSISVPNQYDPSKPTVFKDWKAHGWVDMRRAIAVSSDVYFYEVGGGFEDQIGLGISAIEKYMKKFGFGATTGIDLKGEEAGVIPNPEWKAQVFNGERWYLGNTYHTSIGQYGFQVTALQLALGVASISNGGYLFEPSLLKEVSGSKKDLGIDEDSLTVVKEGMREAVLDGTAAAINISGIKIGGKTGTAEVGVNKEYVNSVIVGFFPYDNPRFAFATIMEKAEAGTPQGAPAVMRKFFEWLVENKPEMTN